MRALQIVRPHVGGEAVAHAVGELERLFELGGTTLVSALLLLGWAQRVESRDASIDDRYVWWGKVRSQNRQTPQAHAVKLVHYLYWFDLLRLSIDVQVPAPVRRAIDAQLVRRVDKLTLAALGEVLRLYGAPDRLARNYVHQMVLLEEWEHLGCVFRRSRPLIPTGSRPLFRRDVGQHSNPKPATVPIRCRPGMAADRSLVLIS